MEMRGEIDQDAPGVHPKTAATSLVKMLDEPLGCLADRPLCGSTSTTCGFGRLEEVHGLATGAEDAGGVGVQGLGQQGGVDVPEISGRDQVVVGQLGEAGLLAETTAGHRLTRDEH